MENKMENKESLFVWGDNWWIESDRAWFAGGEQKMLFSVNMKTDECESAVRIPDESPATFRQMSVCIKCGDDVFCMPVYGESIWVYSTRTGTFSRINISNPNKTILAMYDFWECGNKLFAIAYGLGQVVEILINEKKIANHYRLCDENSIGKSIRFGTLIYSLSGSADISSHSDEIRRFDILTKETKTYRLPDIGRKISPFCFCFDGKQFWMAGYRREIYVWNMEGNSINAISGFPKEFGVYDFSKETDGKADCGADEYEYPAFLYSAAAGGYIWFIPFQTNKIIYVDKKTYEVHALEVPEEDETAESITGRMGRSHKYIMEYVKDDRYIGLFSLKNNCIIEIDAAEKKYRIKHYTIIEKFIREMMAYCNNVLHESIKLDRLIFKHALYKGMAKTDSMTGNTRIANTGKRIYESIQHII